MPDPPRPADAFYVGRALPATFFVLPAIGPRGPTEEAAGSGRPTSFGRGPAVREAASVAVRMVAKQPGQRLHELAAGHHPFDAGGPGPVDGGRIDVGHEPDDRPAAAPLLPRRG